MGLTSALGVYVIGILLAERFSADLPPLLLISPLLFALTALLLRRHPCNVPLLLLFFLTLGGSLYLVQIRPPVEGQHIDQLMSDSPLIVEGTVTRLTPRATGKTSLELALERLEEPQGMATTAKGNIALTILAGVPDCRPGDRIRCRTRLHRPRLFGSPGETDWVRFYAARGITARGTLATAGDMVVLQRGSGWQTTLQRRRLEVGQAIDSVVPSSEAPLVRALVIGDKGRIDTETRDRLARGGISHLFAISGLHLGLVAAALLVPLTFLWRRSETLLLYQPAQRVLPLLLLPLLAVFYFWTGEGISTLRALAMFVAGALLLHRARRSSPRQILAAAALLVLLATPAALFEPAFQLSFAAVAGIFLILPSVLPRLRDWPLAWRWTVAAFLTSAAATLATLPLVAWHFHLLAPAGLFLNPVVIPLIGFLAVPAGLLGALLLPVAPELATLCLQWCGWINALLLRLTDAALALPGLSGSWFYVPPLRIFALVLAALALLLPWQTDWRRWRMLLAAGAATLALLPGPPFPHPGVIAFSVGQGDSFLVTTDDGFTLLVDGGGSAFSDFDPGRQLLAPALGRLGVTHLDAVLLTHGHPDHVNGLRHILRALPVKELWCAAGQEIPPDLQSALTERQIPLRSFPPGWSTLVDHQLQLFVPPRDASENNRSVVLHASFGSQGLLLTGDLEESAVAALVRDPMLPTTTLLKLPHHGSRHSAPALLLDRLHPHLALVSVGYDNPYALPHRSTLVALEERSIPLLRTDRDGTVRFLPRPSGWDVQRWDRGDFH